MPFLFCTSTIDDATFEWLPKMRRANVLALFPLHRLGMEESADHDPPRVVGSRGDREARESAAGETFITKSLVGVIPHNGVSTTRNVTNQFVRI